MSMQKWFFIGGLALISSSTAFSQNEEDALRYSQQFSPSSGRSFGMGGTMGALGADVSSFFSNPAGIGMYKRGGAEISFGLTNVKTNALYNGQGANDFATRFELNNFGIVGAQKSNDKGISFNFGVAYAKSNQFAQNMTIKGNVSNTSILDVFAGQGAGLTNEELAENFPFTAGAALAVNGIRLSSDSLFFQPNAQGDVEQIKNIYRRGHQSITAFAFGMGIQERLYLGLALNFHGSRFTQNSDHIENYGAGEPIQQFVYADDLTSDGNGVSVRIGAIAKPTKWLRVGGAIQTATSMTFREAWDVNTTTSSAANGTERYNSTTLISDYHLRIPARYMANIAFVLGKAGVISADYEYIDYNKIRMNGVGVNSNYNYSLENAAIQNNYKGTHKASAGMEFRLPYHVYCRAGASYAQSPFYKEVADYPSTIAYHGGIGLRYDQWFVDLGLGMYSNQQTLYLYDPSKVSATNIDKQIVRGLISAGMRF